MFRGLHEHIIDQKGRTSVPVRFRYLLDKYLKKYGDAEPVEEGEKPPECLILTTGIDRCLVGYPIHEWLAFEEKLGALSQFDPAVVQLKRIYVAGATECCPDKHGRLMIPPMLREYAGLERDVVWAGMVKTIELWSKERWQEQVEKYRVDRESIVTALAGLGL